MRLWERVQLSSGEGVRKEFQISLVAADPHVYASQIKTAEGLFTAGTNVGARRNLELTVTNAGTTTTPPVIRIDGPIVAPMAYAYLPDLFVLSFPGLTVPAGDFVYIDVGRELIVRNGGTESLVGYLDIATATFWQIPLGSWTVGLQGNTTGYTGATKLTVAWRDAFV